MGTHHFALLFSLLLATGHVTSFSISSRHERSTDLAEALAILQRQRRRVGADFLDPERLPDSRPLTLDDISDWLGTSRVGGERLDGDLESAWISDGEFKDFEPRLEYDLPIDRTPSGPEMVEASQKELEDIFDGENEGDSSNTKPSFETLPEKKKKEEMMNVQGDKKVVQKKSISTDIADAVSAASKEAEAEEDLSLDTLTKEEFRALMKAVSKLQKQAMKVNEKASEEPAEKVTVIETMAPASKEMSIVQPASEDELQSVFEEVKEPGIKETDVVVEEAPDANGNRIVHEEIVSNVSPEEAEAFHETEEELTNALTNELEEDIEAEAEREEAAAEAASEEFQNEIGPSNLATLGKYWLMNKYLDQAPAMKKRTAKRDVGLYPLPEEIDDDISDVRPLDDDVDDDFGIDLAPPALGRFVAKILELQSEVDRLKMVSRLEDLENDVLTDALNEATLAQKEGSVSDMEFESLQQAIRIEEALQDLKNRGEDSNALIPADTIKRGEPWRRKRVPDVDIGSDLSDVGDLSPYPAPHPKITKDDLQRLLGQSYLMREGDDEEDDDDSDESGVASLFVSNADQCPAIQEYSTNCELADLYSLPVDYEARALCNLHEMCYACGNSLRVTQEHCDFVYRTAATALCQEKENCVLESEIFLRTMKLKTRYVPHPQPSCRSTCAAKFLGIL